MLNFVLAIAGACMFVALLSELLLDSGGALTRRGRALWHVVGVLFAISGACLPVMLFILITN